MQDGNRGTGIGNRESGKGRPGARGGYGMEGWSRISRGLSASAGPISTVFVA